jgi:hypothetical protein
MKIMNCPYCGEDKEFLFQMPVVIKAENEDGVIKTYTREGYDKDGKLDKICFDCLKFEVEECL